MLNSLESSLVFPLCLRVSSLYRFQGSPARSFSVCFRASLTIITEGLPFVKQFFEISLGGKSLIFPAFSGLSGYLHILWSDTDFAFYIWWTFQEHPCYNRKKSERKDGMHLWGWGNQRLPMVSLVCPWRRLMVKSVRWEMEGSVPNSWIFSTNI